MAENSVDSIVTDPPYGLGFMGKEWDHGVPGVEFWKHAYDVLKPGGHLLAFSGSRTYHRMVCAIEDAGFEVRDQIMWVYGSGFPKSLDVSKAIDKAAGAERETNLTVAMQKKGEVGEISKNLRCGVCGKARASGNPCVCPRLDLVAVTEAARQWQGWGTALKPAHEPICVARKPLIGTVAANVLHWGTGAINVDGCRVAGESTVRVQGEAEIGFHGGNFAPVLETGSATGRWPANLIHDGSDEVLAAFPDAKGQQGKSNDSQRTQANCYGANTDNGKEYTPRVELETTAARFFYCAKASKKDRDEGLAAFEQKQASGLPMRSAGGDRGGEGMDGTSTDRVTTRANTHPTVKPTDLMAYLCRLVTPPGGVILDPFMGSGSTGKAALREGFRFIGCELDEGYMTIAAARLAAETGGAA